MTKITATTRKSSTKTRSKKSASVKLTHAKHPVLRHFRLIEHKHTGKLLHFRHTSYVALMMFLLVTGFFLAISQNATSAATVTVGAIVQAPPPTEGATITAPVDGFSILNINPSVVSGTCAPDTFVVVYNDGTLSSSTICLAAGTFELSVQLHQGTNVLTARNFDAINQPGPDTSAVTVTFKDTSVPVVTQPTPPVIPESPLIIPGITAGPSECADYQPTATLLPGGEPHVAVVCVPRAIAVAEDHTIGVLVWGGQPPYALNFKWGSGDTTLVSMEKPGYKAVTVHYASSGIYNINIQLTDRTSRPATSQSAIQVTNAGTASTTAITSQPFNQAISSILGSSWFETPVPLYLTAVGVTLGFWGGDIFNRFFGAKSLRRHTMNSPRK
jgi:hypothetical protein